MNNAIKLAAQLFFLSIPSYMLCMNKEQQQEYQNQCLKIHQCYKQKLQRYENELSTKSLKYFEQEKNKLENTFSTKTNNLLTRIQKYDKADINLCNENNLLTSLDIHQSAGCSCITEKIMCTKKMPIFLACYNSPDTAFSMLQIIPQQYYNNFTLQDYGHICNINIRWKKIVLIKNLRSFVFMKDACKTLSILRNINSHISQNK